MTPLGLRIVSTEHASRDEQRRGVFAFLVIEIDDLVQIHVTLRRTQAGRWTLAFPRHVDRDGRHLDLVHPIHAKARARIESEVLRQLGIDSPDDDPPFFGSPRSGSPQVPTSNSPSQSHSDPRGAS